MCIRRRFIGGNSWSSGSRWGGFLLFQIDDSGRKLPLLGQNGKGEGGEHEHGSDHDRKFAEKVGRATAAEDGLTGPAEGRADFCPLP